MTGGSLVGRQGCVDSLGSAVDRVVRGEHAVVEVSGAPGMGKTRMLAEAGALAAAAGLTVYEGRAAQLGGPVPFALFHDLLPPRADGHAAIQRVLSARPAAVLLDDLQW